MKWAYEIIRQLFDIIVIWIGGEDLLGQLISEGMSVGRRAWLKAGPLRPNMYDQSKLRPTRQTEQPGIVAP